ncbi:MAG: heme ABC transporter permease [Pseudomonadota bacterium]
MNWTWFHKLGSPPTVFAFCGALKPWLLTLGLIGIGIGIWQGLFVAPADYQQSDAYRIIFVHVPAAYIAQMCYMLVGIASFVALVWRMKVGHAVAAAAAPIGASFTVLALATGSIWGRPMWGTWWEWGDPRLTSVLILLFLYVGYMVLRASVNDPLKGDRAAALLAVVGLVNLPIIRYSVVWWSSLHQGATLITEDGPRMPPAMLTPLLISLAGFTLLFGYLLASRLRGELVAREKKARWLRDRLGNVTSNSGSSQTVETLFIVVALTILGGYVGVAFLYPQDWPVLSAIRDSMSGYGAFVWLSYYLGFVIVVWNMLNAANRVEQATQSARRYAIRHEEVMA